MINKNPFYNLALNILDQPSFLKAIEMVFKESRPARVFFINAHCFNLAQANKKYYDCLHSAEMVLNDGIGIKIAGKLARVRFPENMNGTDLIPRMIEFAAKNHKKVFLLGGEPGIAGKASINLQKKYPELNISGYHSGYFSPEEEKNIVDMIVTSGTDLLVVGMGVPRQELWITKNFDRLSSVSLQVAGGAIIDFMAEKVKRAPDFLRNSGLEWTYRLYQEPRRLFKRYVFGNFLFFYHVFKLRWQIPKSKIQPL